MKIIFLLPPSEGKNIENKYRKEEISFSFEKPLSIAEKVTEKDLKCTGNRFNEGLNLNKNIINSETIEAIERYSGVMYNAIDYSGMNKSAKGFFEDNFLIFSGMYGIVKPLDKIGNYKLPIGKADLYKFWWEKIPEAIIEQKPDYIVNLLPISYAKLIGLGTNCNRHKKKLEMITDAGIKIININFLKPDKLNSEGIVYALGYGKKLSHGVKKIKGEWIKNICENNLTDVNSFGGEVIENGNILDVNIVCTK